MSGKAARLTRSGVAPGTCVRPALFLIPRRLPLTVIRDVQVRGQPGRSAKGRTPRSLRSHPQTKQCSTQEQGKLRSVAACLYVLLPSSARKTLCSRAVQEAHIAALTHGRAPVAVRHPLLTRTPRIRPPLAAPALGPGIAVAMLQGLPGTRTVQM